ncbi:MAG: serine/threonine protein phosphatase, partial [Campylobacter sp.]|nr:serine/threonine protein phosphatase [Campylobacter sp.]
DYHKFKNNDGRHLVVSHSAVGRMWRLRNSLRYESEFREHLLCGRNDWDKNDDIFNVFGHTPTYEPIIKQFAANIDLGCVYQYRFHNPRLCALEFPSMRIFTQKNIEY